MESHWTFCQGVIRSQRTLTHHGHHKQLPQTWWFKTTKNSSFIIPEATHPTSASLDKHWCWWDRHPSVGSSSPPAPAGCCPQFWACGCITLLCLHPQTVSCSVCLISLYLFLILVTAFKFLPDNPWGSHLKILNLITSAKISLTHYPPTKVQVPEMNSLLGGPTTLDSMQCGTGACRDNDQKSVSSKEWKSWTKALIMKMGEKMENSDDGYLDMGRVWGEGVIKDTFTFVVCMVGRWRMPLAQTGPT